MNPYYPHLFEPMQIGPVYFKNRILLAPSITRNKTSDGHVTDYELAYMDVRAQGGAAAVILGETPVTNRYGNQRRCCVYDITDTSVLAGLSEMANTIRIRGAVPSIQLGHCGMHSQPANSGGRNPIGPSACVRHDGVQVEEMDDTAIDRVVEEYAAAAALVQQAGFQMCQLQAGHGWLLHQFLSPRTNLRTDEYGGTPEKRAKFPLRVIDAIKARCGKGFLIELRVSGREGVPGGMELEETIGFLKLCEGKIDLINVSNGHHNEPPAWEFGPTPHVLHPQGYFVPMAEAIKKSGIKTPVSVVGSITTPEMAEEIIATGKADFVGMARALIADPELPNKARKGQREEIIPCLRCNVCLGSMSWNDCLLCAVNPRMGRELRELHNPPAGPSRKVAVIGGGPGGMTAACTAADRGHQVTLFEAADKLGGRLNTLRLEYLKEDYGPYLAHMTAKTLKKVEVRLNTAPTPEDISREGFDVVIAALGGQLIQPPIPGIETTLPITEVHSGAVIGKNVVVLGGGTAGCECAFELAEQGHPVTLVEMKDKLGLEDKAVSKNVVYSLPILMRILKHPNITVLKNTTCLAVEEGAVTLRTPDGETKLACDTVVCAAGVRHQMPEALAYHDCAPDFYMIGDCASPARVAEANQQGYYAAISIR